MQNLKLEGFGKIKLEDSFFDSLKEDYPGFCQWFQSKIDSGASAYVIRDNGIKGFVYLKMEDGAVMDIDPPLPDKKHLKVGTLKIIGHGTKLGQRFVKKIFDNALAEGAEDVYVTVYPKHQYLIQLLETYGFKKRGTKTSAHGNEIVLVKDFSAWHVNPLENYPLIKKDETRAFLLAIYPELHTQFLPDSKLFNESYDVVQDVSHTNSIHKTYISGISATGKLKTGDLLLMYRTSDRPGQAKYRSVATSVGVVEEIRKVGSFANEKNFLDYVRPYSVYSAEELKTRYATKKRHVIIKFTYNIALKKRLIRDRLINEIGISTLRRWDYLPLTQQQFEQIMSLGEVDERYFIN